MFTAWQFKRIFNIDVKYFIPKMDDYIVPKNKHSPLILRLLNIQGYEDRHNDVIYCSPQTQVEKPDTLVFFGGDVQDFTENMKSHRDNKNYLTWNLENTARLLQKNFTNSHIVVVKPSRMDFKTFSCFENFVPSNKCGVPGHIMMYNSLNHLEKLLHNISQTLKTISAEDMLGAMKMSREALIEESDTPRNALPEKVEILQTFGEDFNLAQKQLTFIGFSKGCVVLNQFLYEFQYYSKNSQTETAALILSRIKDMYWLDGGHNGGKDTWITYKSILKSLTTLDVMVHIHVTPYQIADDRRPWIKKEEKLFTDTLRKLGVSVRRKVHFEQLPASVLTHFNLLKVFNKDNDDC